MSRSDVQDFCVGKTGIWSVLNHSDPVTDVDDVSRHKRPFGATLPCRCNLVYFIKFLKIYLSVIPDNVNSNVIILIVY